MNHIYLSPAFSKRTQEELEFLQKIDWTTGFSLFWIDIVRPLLCKIKAKHLLEIGADEGKHTKLLIQYCNSFDAHLTIIEPTVKLSLQKIINDSTQVRLFIDKSHNALAKIDDSTDVVLLDGDLNYYSTYDDLINIEQLSIRNNIPFPVVLARSASWPYARRDMYYDPESIPAVNRHEYARKGLTPWSPELKDGMINFPFANAKHEGGPKNGKLTAIEDFIRDSKLDLQLFTLRANNGLGIIYTKGSLTEEFIMANLIPPSALSLFIETWELARINSINHKLKNKQHQQPRQRFLHKFLHALCTSSTRK